MATRVLLPTPPYHNCHRATAAAATTTSGTPLSHCALPAAQRFRQLNGVSLVVAAAVPPEQTGYEAVGNVKAELYRALEGADRGIFGMTSAKRSEIHGLVELLESRNPTPEPTAKLQEKRVDIKLESSTITPDQLMNIFQKNYDLLLAIFNPEGWLEITYVDESLRIGRGDKDNTFVLKREDPSEV